MMKVENEIKKSLYALCGIVSNVFYQSHFIKKGKIIMNLRTIRTIKFNLIFLSLFGYGSLAVSSCNTSSVIASTPTADFTVHNDGTVTHKKTGLMWKVCSEGQTWSSGNCSGSASNYRWDEALQAAQGLNSGGGFAGNSDWRLPNVKELKSIVEMRCSSPAINTTIFNNTPSSYYWSSSPNFNNDGKSLQVSSSSGRILIYQRNSGEVVRLVRGGQ